MRHAEEFKVETSKGVIVCGLSAGANLAMGLTLRTRSDPFYRETITGQLLQFPPTWNSGGGDFKGK